MAIFKKFAAAVALGALTSTAVLAQEAVPPMPQQDTAPEAVPPQDGAPDGQNPQEVPPSLRDLFGQMFGQQKPEPPKDEVCFGLAEYMKKLKEEANEDYVMDKYYDGDVMPQGHYTITAAPDTGSWTLIVDPDTLDGFNTSCDGEHDVFHIDGNDYGYPYAVEGDAWYGEVFKKPLRQLIKFEESKKAAQPVPALKLDM